LRLESIISFGRYRSDAIIILHRGISFLDFALQSYKLFPTLPKSLSSFYIFFLEIQTTKISDIRRERRAPGRGNAPFIAS
jgi:hypothetical protein